MAGFVFDRAREWVRGRWKNVVVVVVVEVAIVGEGEVGRAVEVWEGWERAAWI
jgi:hypothetical protein